MLLLLTLSCGQSPGSPVAGLSNPAAFTEPHHEIVWYAQPESPSTLSSQDYLTAPAGTPGTPRPTSDRVDGMVEMWWVLASETLRLESALGCSQPGSCTGMAGVADSVRDMCLSLADRQLARSEQAD